MFDTSDPETSPRLVLLPARVKSSFYRGESRRSQWRSAETAWAVEKGAFRSGKHSATNERLDNQRVMSAALSRVKVVMRGARAGSLTLHGTGEDERTV